ncbi:UDP-N-acetylglucosamine 4,6-dehydratase (inverting) [Pseudodesulfovibrio pelocollis]|uniref:UDP-N-acetylglucosamine 4,6-dehydratase (inverting) n=1 Tax=Pseudodesulfovibrio pelocollis TaxID=3051432 RepID=UPI00255AFCA6|nr:UDP-N-acetylglucosamine 4,6-dehydratase (inverting) [Pseudodesulfovibrio sp. SB368]
MLDGKTILITGGTGSFGKRFVQIVLERYKPKKLIVFSRDELKQFEMAQDYPPDKFDALRFFIGDVRDKERLYRACRGVDVIVHAAAMKHVPASEYNPTEAIKTNINGAQNLINVAADLGVEKVVALSTDKAVAPCNLYGATKLASDKLFVAANGFAVGPTYSVVRYGNVLGSRGSVVPFFLKKREEGVLPITDPRMTRFWITLDEGIQMVLNAIEHAAGGEIFVPRIPSMKITDLAEAIAPGCRTEIVGIRPGEKLHECMIPAEDSRNVVITETGYIILPETGVFNYKGDASVLRRVPEGFAYSSDTNDKWISVEELRTILAQQGFTL